MKTNYINNVKISAPLWGAGPTIAIVEIIIGDKV